MAQITEKELSALSDLMTAEKTMAAKCKQLAEETTDSVLKNRYEQSAARHQNHYAELYANLK